MAATGRLLPPVGQMLDRNGNVTVAWMAYFQAVGERSAALPGGGGQEDAIAALDAEVKRLDAEAKTLNASVANLNAVAQNHEARLVELDAAARTLNASVVNHESRLVAIGA